MTPDISKQKVTYYIEPLEGESNYELWSIRLAALLAREGLSNYIRYPDYGIEPTIEDGPLDNPSLESQKTTSIIKLNLYDGPLLLSEVEQ
ncbi:hypothetical protein N7G274_010894 [Stereocaulon virgatum]|uniref:Retrotransposon Copia-like N-terminal domain-containing protein n=1 Tax=Stereocaulon virgatum TaxID=373712 RepID=A0ABR3ZSQ4_9LECA